MIKKVMKVTIFVLLVCLEDISMLNEAIIARTVVVFCASGAEHVLYI